MIIPKDTPFKVLKYLSQLHTTSNSPLKYEKEKVIIYLLDNKYLEKEGKRVIILKDFATKYREYILPVFQNINSFVSKHKIEYIEDYYTIFDCECLLKIESDKDKLEDYTFQQILTEYFNSSKHTKKDSNLASAIKAVLGINYFIEDDKDQQFLSILFPKNATRFIFLCENNDRLRNPRHEYIEFWYVGGNNINQIQFIPLTTVPIFYLCDLDFDGLNIYNNIKKKYLRMLKLFIPKNFEQLMIKQTEVKEHRSIWKNDNILKSLNDREKRIANVLLGERRIIEEQRILLTRDNLEFNGIL